MMINGETFTPSSALWTQPKFVKLSDISLIEKLVLRIYRKDIFDVRTVKSMATAERGETQVRSDCDQDGILPGDGV